MAGAADQEPPGLLLVHSPLVGPLTWRRTGAALAAAGRAAVLPFLTGVLDGPGPYHERLAERVAGAAARARGPLVLVVHSGAGALVPAIVAATPGLAGAIFADAGLPAPGAAWLESAPAELRAHLLGLAEGGRLPPWHRWFPPEALAEILPDPGLRAAFMAELGPLPLAWFAEPAPEAAGWPAAPPLPCAYLLLSAAYEGDAAAAAAAGWPVERVTGAGGQAAGHLGMLTAADGLAARLAALADRLGG